jgi:hypothetical protein
MRSSLRRVSRTLVFVVVAGTLAAAPASAANKEHQQLMADIRMLQEQSQLLQNMLGTLNESIRAVNTRLEQQDAAVRKAFADQKLAIDNLTGDLRVVREKVDDNNVRIGSSGGTDALRQTVQQAITARRFGRAPRRERRARFRVARPVRPRLPGTRRRACGTWPTATTRSASGIWRFRGSSRTSAISPDPIARPKRR